MITFQKLALRQKLILIGIFSAAIAMLLAGMLMLAAELSAYRDALVTDLTVKAEIIGDQCSAALLFKASRDAEETLRSLRADPEIVFAAVYTAEGSLFALYERPGEPPLSWTAQLPPEGHRFGLDHLDLLRHIQLQNRKIGSILIRTDLRRIEMLLLRYATATVVVLAAALLAAYVLVSRLQETITGPVRELVGMMRHVSRHEDFSVRAPESGEDEIGELARGFNEMLSAIQDRDLELDARRRDLEKTVVDLERSSRELTEANRKLRELDRLKSDFISVASHELRTPLTSIKVYVELMLLKPDMPAARKARVLSNMNAETDRLSRLVRDLLDLSRIDTGTMPWRITDVSLEDVVRRSVTSMQALAQNKQQQLSADIDPGLPLVRGDRDRLIQVVTNLLSNAVKFTPEDGKIQVSARRLPDDPSMLLVCVQDNGRGIPPEDLDLVFGRFQRSGDHLTSGVEGTGLGLAIAREIVQFHGGTIWVESTYGQGSKFCFMLSLSQRPEPDTSPHPAPDSLRRE